MTRKTLPILALLMFGGTAGGCMARARTVAVVEPMPSVFVVSGPDVVIVEPAPAIVVFREPPPLVFVESDVYVVQNSGYAIYFVDDSYWHYRSGTWFHASHWDEPWARVEVDFVPSVIVTREHHHYVHYRGATAARVWREPKERPRDRGRELDRDREPARAVRPQNEPATTFTRRKTPIEPADMEPISRSTTGDRQRAARAHDKPGADDKPRADEKPRAEDERKADSEAKKKAAAKKKADDKKKKKKGPPQG